jgi:hypothetical protein
MIIMPRIDNVFPMENICFYKTSGRSNDSKFGGMWIPTPGFVNMNFKTGYEKTDESPLTIGNIIKGTDLHLKKKWAYELLSEYFFKLYNLHLNSVLDLIFGETDNKIIQSFIDLFPFVTLYDKLISSYFCSKQQLCMSAFLGSGLWESDEEFIKLRGFLLENEPLPSLAIELSNTALYFDKPESEFESLARGFEETKRFLIDNNAQICIGRCEGVQEEVQEEKKKFSGFDLYNMYVASYGQIILQLIRTIFSVQRLYRSNPEKIVFHLDDIDAVLKLEPSLITQLPKNLKYRNI